MDFRKGVAFTSLRRVWRGTLLVTVFQCAFHHEALADEFRLVPQLGLTDLDPRQVTFAPNNNDLLAVLNSSGRIDLFDIVNVEEPVKIGELPVGALSVAFSPDGARIVSGGSDRTVRLWTLQGQAIGVPFEGHSERVLSVAFSPDGERIVSGSADGTVRLWTLQGQAIGVPFEGHDGPVYSVAFSPDGARIVSGGEDGTVRLWTLQGQAIGVPFEGHGGSVRSVAFSPDGTRIVSGGSDRTVRLWTLQGQAIGAPFKGHDGRVYSVAFSPDGARIVSGGSDRTVRLWTLQGQAIGVPFEGHSEWVYSVAFSPDGARIVSGGRDGTVRLWALQSQAIGAPFKGHSEWVYSVAFSPDGARIVSGGEDGTVRLWTLQGQAIGDPFEGHDGSVYSVAFSPDGTRIVSGGSDRTVRLWTLQGQAIGAPFKGHDRGVTSLAFSPDGARIVSGGGDGAMRLWTLQGQAIGDPFEGHGGWVYSVAFSTDGARIVSGGEDGAVRLWTLQGQAIGVPFEGHGGSVRSVAFSPDGARIASGGNDGTVRLWTLQGQAIGDPFEGQAMRDPFKGPGGSVSSVAFSPDGARIVSGSFDGTVRLWTLQGQPIGDPFEGQAIWDPFKGHGGRVWSVAFSPDGARIVSGGTDGTVRLWTLQGQAIGAPFEGHDHSVYSVAFSPDGARIVSGGEDGTVRLWTLQGQAIGAPFKGHDGRVQNVAFSPDGARIVSGGEDGTVRLWTLQGQAIGAPFKGHDGRVQNVAFSPDGARIVSGGGDGTVRLWTLQGQAIGVPFEGHDRGVLSVAFSPDGARIVSGSFDRTVRLWSLTGESSTLLHHCLLFDTGYLKHHVVWARCSDRFVFFNAGGESLGQLFLTEGGLVTVMRDGVYAPTDDLFTEVAGFEGTTRLKKIPEISLEDARHILLNDCTFFQRFISTLAHAGRWVASTYDKLGYYKLPFWPALFWFLLALSTILLFLLSPHKLANRAMSMADNSQLPSWKWLVNLLTLYTYLGTTRRALKAWLQKNRQVLYWKNFEQRDPVKDRERYHVLAHEQAIESFAQALHKHQEAKVWISGPGGGGKSALAYQIARTACKGPKAPIPILLDEDWPSSVAAQVACLMRVDGRQPTESMVRTLGANGLICPIIDSLSERGMVDALETTANATKNFKAMVVTSRSDAPEQKAFEGWTKLTARALEIKDIPAYVNTYVPDETKSGDVLKQIEPLFTSRILDQDDQTLSPLYVRFAIERALDGTINSASPLDLIFNYVEALRKGRVDLNPADIVRAASIAAFETLRASPTPREIEESSLRGALNTESDRLPFMNATNETKVDPAAIVEMLVTSGILNRNRTNQAIQFAYDPVAEYLAADRLWKLRDQPGIKPLISHLRHEPSSALARAFGEIEQGAITKACQRL